MPNPRFMSREGEPTPELLERMTLAKQVIYANATWFAEKYPPIQAEELRRADKVYLIGSHAGCIDWNDDTSDVDIAIVNMTPELLPEYLHRYKRKVLRPLLCVGEKRRWNDVWFLKEDYQVREPRCEITDHWNRLSVKKGE